MKRRTKVKLTWTSHIDKDRHCYHCGGRHAELVWWDDGGLLVWAVWLHRECAKDYIRQLGGDEHEEGAFELEH